MGMDDFLDDMGNLAAKGWSFTPIASVADIFQGKTPALVQHNVPLQQVLHGSRWLWDNAMSQPMSTLTLQTRRAGVPSWAQGSPLALLAAPVMNPNEYFSTKNWSDSWNAANHISPGQAFFMSPEEAEKAIKSPLLYYKPPEAYLPAGFKDLPEAQQQQILRDAGMPAVGNQYVEKMRGDSAWFKYGTGALDFSNAVFMDPTILALKGAGVATRRALGTQIRPQAGWTGEDIDKIMARTNVQKLRDGILANQGNPQFLYNTTLAQRSGMGPAKFASIVTKLRDGEELDLFLRTGMGDMKAMEELWDRNAAIEASMKADTARIDALNLMRANYANFPATQRIVDVELARVQRGINADAVMHERYADILATQGQLDKIYASKWAVSAAEKRTAAQNRYVAGAARPTRRAVRAETALDTGFIQTRLWGVADFFSMPALMVRSIREAHPNGYINVGTLDKDSIDELRGFLARVPNMRPSARQKVLNDYMRATTEAQRLDILEDTGRMGAAKVANRHGLTAEEGVDLYRDYMRRQSKAKDDMKAYSAGRRTPEEVAALRQQHGMAEVPYGTDPLARIDTFVTQDGQVLAPTPFTVTRLVNSHVMMDLDTLNTVLSRHAGKFRTIRQGGGSTLDAIENLADGFSQLWKFTTLFRLGYAPRILGDELASQWVALGAAAMAMRTGRAVTNAFDNVARKTMGPALRARESTSRVGADFAERELKVISEDSRTLRQQIAVQEAANDVELRTSFRRHQAAQAKLAAAQAGPAPATLAQAQKRAALETFARQREQQLRQAEARVAAGASPGKKAALKSMEQRADHLTRYRDLQLRAADEYAAQQVKVKQGNQPVTIDDVTFPAAFGGQQGAYYKDLLSADSTVGNLLNTNKQMLHGNIQRSFDHGSVPLSAKQAPKDHLNAWAHVINNQIMQDAMQMQFVRGASEADVLAWMRTPQGRAYRARMPKMVDEADFVSAARHEVDQYMHAPELRAKALEGPVTPGWLEKAFPTASDRPDVHAGRTLAGTRQAEHALGRVRDFFFRTVVGKLSEEASRHPLYNQLYEGHLKKLRNQRQAQGYDPNKLSVGEVDQLASSARALAYRDTRDLIFDMTHRSDAAAAMRFISPFFSATAESFQRWGKIIANKPQVVGYAAMWYNWPLAIGATQDMDGNHVDQYGYTYIPTYPLGPDGRPDYSQKPTVTKRLVPKSERLIVARVPKWAAEDPILSKALNVTAADSKLLISQNSMNLVTQGDPWFNPGVGPIVQIPVNEYVKDKPRAAAIARELSVLPYGPQGGGAFGENVVGRAINAAAPSTIRNFLTSFDTSDSRYQQIKLQVMQREMFLFQQHNGRPPTPEESRALAQKIADQTKNYWLFSAVTAFTQPFATQRKDPYQFYRDQYNALRRQNPLTADDEFLSRYGDSYFIFAQEASRSYGIPPTDKAVKLSQKYAKEIASTPELAALLIGPDGNGPFSREAYAYQLNTPIAPGSAEMQRTRMTADEMMEENQRRLGWAKYTAVMNMLNANLRSAGFTSFQDKGAERFKIQKRAYAMLFAEPLLPDGTPNPGYNEAWSKDFYTQDQRKYERMVRDLTTVAYSPMSEQSERSDLRTLRSYLAGRAAMNTLLGERKAAGLPSTLAAKANEDLRRGWGNYVDGLIESDTRFGDLYHRYLSRDMGVDVEEER